MQATDEVDDQLTALGRGHSPDSADLIRHAGEFARQAHAGQTCFSGEDFIRHPLAVAAILYQQGMSSETIAAGLLHATLEECQVSAEQLRTLFGEEVSRLVEGVTKIQQLAPAGSRQRGQSDTYRKLLLAATEDLRVLVIELADRLHNVRTLSSLEQSQQKKTAQETLEIYAPLAYRLGMVLWKEEMEDLALKTLDPDGYREAGLLQRERGTHAGPALHEMTRQLEAELLARDMEAEISTRVKSRYSIYRKMQRTREDIADVLGLRIIVKHRPQCYAVLGIAHALWPPRFDRFKDYIAAPRANLYQSLHTTVIGLEGQPVEVQIRTQSMHQMAEQGVAAHWLYKELLSEGGPRPTRRFIKALADHVISDPESAFKALRQEAFQEEIFVFTPRGDIRLLPAGSTPIDFAYAVHTDIGHHCVGARINGELQPLHTELVSGDRVEIMQSPRAKPEKEWLEWAITSRAKQRIRSFHHSVEEPSRVAEGQRQLQEHLRRADLHPWAEASRLGEVAELLGFDSPVALALEATKEGKARQLVTQLLPRLATAAALGRPSRYRPAAEIGITVNGRDDAAVRLAGCCSPEPGGEIAAYASVGHGVSVHRRDCSQLKKQLAKSGSRVLPAQWSAKTQVFRSEMFVVFVDRPALLKDISQAVEEEGAEMAEIALKTKRKMVRGSVTVMAASDSQAERIRARLAALPGALQVQRA